MNRPLSTSSEMSPQALVLDGLWYSLCPSFNQLTLRQPSCLLRSRKHSFRPCPRPAIRIAPVLPRRCYSSQHKLDDSSTLQNKTDNVIDSHEDTSTFTPSPESQSNSLADEAAALDSSDYPHRPRTHRQKPPRYQELPLSYEGKTAADLERMLKRKTKSPELIGTTHSLRALIRDLRVKPATRHYEALILANCDSRLGAPEAVESLLNEMEDNGIKADSKTLHAALKVLAVHPDHLLRQDVIRMLRDRWLTLSPEGWHFVVAGLLREHQFELALDQMSAMERKGIRIDNWLHSMAVYQLCDFNELDEVYALMQARVEQNREMTPALWSHVLSAATQALHYDMTRFIWRRMVDLGYLKPAPNVHIDALIIASNAGDIDLALAVFRSCDELGIPLDAEDYQRVIDIYLRLGYLAASFKVLCTMHDFGVVPAERSTESLVSHMIEHKTDPREAWQMLKRLKNDKQKVPITCVHVIAKLCERRAHDDPSVVEDAIGFYKEIYSLCPEGADVHVYNTLMQMCRNAQNRESGLFLVKEMASFGVVPNATTFEALILMCLDARNYQSAYMYLRDMLDRGDEVSDESRDEIRDLCSQSVHEFAVRLQHHPAVQPVERPPIDKEPALPAPPGNETGHRRYGRPWVRAAFRRQTLSDEDRIAWNKKRRQNKRRYEAIARKAEAES